MKRFILSLSLLLMSTIVVFAQIPTNGLVAWYPFNGNANDSSGNGHNGTVVGATAASDRFGKAGRAYSFNGSSNSIATNTSLLNGFSSLTATGWIFPTTLGNRIGFFGQNDLFEFGFLDTTNMDAWLDRVSIGVLVATSQGLLNNWHMVTATANADSLWFYVDGKMGKATALGVSSFGSTQYFFNIGGGGIFDPTGNFFSGSLDDIRIYNRALSPAEVDTLYHEGGWQSSRHDSLTNIANTLLTVPKSPTLYQAFPNPFNPSTTIRYSLPTRSRVRLAVYNILGQIVAELVNGEQISGWNQVVWNANVSSGLYFYRLEAISVSDPGKQFVDVKKMVLLK